MKLFKILILSITLRIVVLYRSLVECEYTGKQVLKHMSQAIGETVNECQNEVQFNNDIITDFLNYWEQDYSLMNTEMGCVVYCVMLRLEVTEPNGTLRIENAKAFCHANGADDTQTEYLTTLYDRCKTNMTFMDPCSEGLKMAACFRSEVIKIDYGPDPDDDPDDEF